MLHAFQRTVVIILMLPFPAVAMPTITCHCFKDRSYEPAHPAAADPYFLATTQNSFFALVFNIDKKTIMMEKQQGTSSDDLWVAYWVSERSGTAPETLLQARQKNETWHNVLAPLRLSTKAMGARFSNALSGKSSSVHLAEAVVDELLLRYRLQSGAELTALRKAGASNQEIILADVIAARTGQPAIQMFRAVKNGSKTWGALLQWAKIDTNNMHREVSRLLKLSSQ